MVGYVKMYPKYPRKVGINIPEDYYEGSTVLLIPMHISMGTIIA